jgi:hypothetical protein
MKLRNISFAALAVAATLSLAACSPTTPIPEPQSFEGACTESKPGVTLAVDYLGAVEVRCASNFNGNGWELFRAAGFEVLGTNKYPTAFACKINGQPADAKCDDSPGAYWGYYLATGDSWDYATTGASDQVSKCGSWEGWVYMETEDTVSSLPTPKTFVCS